ncbi:HD domain-containing protein [Laceyella putida]|uniref:HD domain-containing protein n=1 Tax=Laceyella putida TaxID=110101 RepID=A0ABW2RQU2_9BACL
METRRRLRELGIRIGKYETGKGTAGKIGEREGIDISEDGNVSLNLLGACAVKGKAAVMDRERLAQYLAPHEPRYQHILGTVRRMESLLPDLDVPPAWRSLLVQACFLHDIGYSPSLNQYQFHPLDGAIFALSQGFAKPVVAAVLYHSGARELADRTRPDLAVSYRENDRFLNKVDRLFIDLVTYCDLHTSPTGEAVSLDERVGDVVRRYGEEHEVSRTMRLHVPLYEETIARVRKLMKRDENQRP